jgi:hypothetical protein
MNKNRTSEGTAQARKATTATVRMALNGDENRLARNHPIGPVAISGGGNTDTR